MKIRNDFVSNSSSSSYIVIATSGDTIYLDQYVNEHPLNEWYAGYEFPNTTCDYQFGWENCIYNGIITKLNFIGIQLLTLIRWKLDKAVNPNAYSCINSEHFRRLDEYIDRVKRVLKDLKINARFSSDLLRYDVDENFFSVKDAYIDHQSAVEENENMDMLDSDDALTNFLKYDDSYIQGGNDNE